MNITVYGAGYVGLVTAACFADKGHNVLVLDISQEKIKQLQAGNVPIYEPGLAELIQAAQAKNNIQFTTDTPAAVLHGDYHFIAVGTPSDSDGQADLQYVLQVASDIGRNIAKPAIVIDKSTVPVGTAKKVSATIEKQLTARQLECRVAVVSNPEFLKEGSALEDFQKPDRVVIGADDAKTAEAMWDLYADFVSRNKFITMDLASAELTKYASNAMLAMKISFMNQLSQLAEKVGADIDNVKHGMAMDRRIGPHFLNAGCGFGGSCFPKDVSALVHTGHSVNADVGILENVIKANEQQKHVIFNKINNHFAAELDDIKIAVWGLSFKPNTDDMREAPSITTINALLDAGAIVQAYDPVAMDEAKKVFASNSNLVFCESKEAACESADALVILTEWTEFKNLDTALVKNTLSQPIIFDGRNTQALADMAEKQITYYSIGRPAVNEKDDASCSYEKPFFR